MAIARHQNKQNLFFSRVYVLVVKYLFTVSIPASILNGTKSTRSQFFPPPAKIQFEVIKSRRRATPRGVGRAEAAMDERKG